MKLMFQKAVSTTLVFAAVICLESSAGAESLALASSQRTPPAQCVVTLFRYEVDASLSRTSTIVDRIAGAGDVTYTENPAENELVGQCDAKLLGSTFSVTVQARLIEALSAVQRKVDVAVDGVAYFNSFHNRYTQTPVLGLNWILSPEREVLSVVGPIAKGPRGGLLQSVFRVTFMPR